MPIANLKFSVPLTRVQRLSEMTAPPQEWLWLQVIPRGAVTLITGEAGVGKSLLVTEFAAAVTLGKRGPHDLPDTDPAAVMFVSQTRLDMTALRRLDAAGADLSRVYAVEFGPDPDGIEFDQPIMSDFELDEWITPELTLTDRLILLEQELSGCQSGQVDVRMVVIDSLHGFTGTISRKCDPDRFARGLMELAARFGIAIVVVVDAEAGRRGPGTNARQAQLKQAIELVAQSIWTIRRDPENLWRRVLLPVKANLCEYPFGIACSIRQGIAEWEHGCVEIPCGQITERGWTPTEQLIGNEEFSELFRATEWLRNQLSGHSEFSTSIRADAKEHDISARTLRRAFRRLNGFHSVDKETGKWLWHLPATLHGARPSSEEIEECSLLVQSQDVESSAAGVGLNDLCQREILSVESVEPECNVEFERQPLYCEAGESHGSIITTFDLAEVTESRETSAVQQTSGTPECQRQQRSANPNGIEKLSNVGQRWPSTNSASNAIDQACWPKVANVVQT